MSLQIPIHIMLYLLQTSNSTQPFGFPRQADVDQMHLMPRETHM